MDDVRFAGEFDAVLGRAARIVAACCVLMMGAGAAFAATTPACDQAVEHFDAQFGDRSDDEALTAARDLDTPCAKPGAALARALSRQAFIHYQRHDEQAAITAYEEAIRLNPTSPTLRMNLCGVYTQAGRHPAAIATCTQGLELAKQQDDGTAENHAKVLDLGFNLALAKTRRGGGLCSDRSIYTMFDAYHQAHPEHAWVYQLLGAWVWDCENDFDRGLALYKKSCALGQKSACDQVAYTESCKCETRSGEAP